MTDAEKLLWSKIRRKQLNGVKFCRQKIVGNYIVDFLSFDKKLIIELDGGQHADQVEYDKKRTAFLEQQGFTVIRFWNTEVLRETD
ncbi:endonuclease domain-containing protein, partial [Glaesserella parasuis]